MLLVLLIINVFLCDMHDSNLDTMNLLYERVTRINLVAKFYQKGDAAAMKLKKSHLIFATLVARMHA